MDFTRMNVHLLLISTLCIALISSKIILLSSNETITDRMAAFGPPLPSAGLIGVLLAVEFLPSSSVVVVETPKKAARLKMHFLNKIIPQRFLHGRTMRTSAAANSNPTTLLTTNDTSHQSSAAFPSNSFAPQKGCHLVRIPERFVPSSFPWIALVERGACSFSEKVRMMQRSGASGVFVGDNEKESGLLTMFPSEDASDIVIPSAFVSQWVYKNLRYMAGQRMISWWNRTLQYSAANFTEVLSTFLANQTDTFHVSPPTHDTITADNRDILHSDSPAAANHIQSDEPTDASMALVFKALNSSSNDSFRLESGMISNSNEFWIQWMQSNDPQWPMMDILIVTLVAPTVIMIFLYSLWRFRRRRILELMMRQRAALAALQASAANCHPSSALTVDQFDACAPTIYENDLNRHGIELTPEDICSVCLEGFHGSHIRIISACKHIFHSSCIETVCGARVEVLYSIF